MSLALVIHYLILNMFRMLIHPSTAIPQRNTNTHRTRSIQAMR